MSRVGKNPIQVPTMAKVEILPMKSRFGGQLVKVTGPKGELVLDLRPEVSLQQNEQVITMGLQPGSKTTAYQGLYRTLVNNAILGVTTGYTKELEIIGIGYKAEVTGNSVKLNIGFTHPVVFPLPAGIKAEVTENTAIKISGFDKQVVGEVAAQLRKIRPPEPYKGKGIRYKNEYVKKKEGKAAA